MLVCSVIPRYLCDVLGHCCIGGVYGFTFIKLKVPLPCDFPLFKGVKVSLEELRVRMGDWRLFGMFGVIGVSCVKTEWNCGLSGCAVCSGVLTRVSLSSLRAAILVVSCLWALKNLKKCLGLLLILPAMYFLKCSRSAFFMFLANVLLKSLKAAQFSGVLYGCVRL